ncbi:transglycosylase domain-containing protein [Paenibacillus thermotolerans]|uniref:transglycosylase domain-containing protein n=1 Tax=Paenibacillus thermotolerans TaxID=3027807 RepID=UPI002367C851|nr:MULTISPECIES: PBP1A family penicillin-binding protein [unclassified Paenibacillus]
MKLKVVAWGIVFVIAFVMIAGIGGAGYAATLDVSELSQPMSRPTIVLDRNGEKVYSLSVVKSQPISISEMPDVLLEAIVAVEDKRFYEHSGVDINSIVRALYRDLKEGEYVEGGSTITMQLAKNAFLSSDKSIKRKLKQAAYALKIDMSYNKDQILERYLNTIYFGEGAWGVQAASRKYFGKDAKQLTLEEAALIAGLPKAPSKYSPVRNPEGAFERRNLVLKLMLEQGKISVQEFNEASKKQIVLQPDEEEKKQAKYASYVDAVIEEAIREYGISEKEIMSGGWTIVTEMDRRAQEIAADVYSDASKFPESENGQLLQSGSVFLDQHSGGIVALVGYRGTDATYRAFNRATQLKRQPGSAFKPIAVYGPSLEEGYHPYSVLFDGPLDVNGYRPRNWDRQYHEEVTMAEAIRQSWNIPAVWLLNEIGVEKGLRFAEKLGIPLTKEDRNLGLALGGLSEGVSPMQMAQAFSAFANNGTMHDAHTIRLIKSPDGTVAGEYNRQPNQVMEPNHAYTMTLLLQHAVAEGTGKKAAVAGRPTAGKTGTTQLPDTKEFQGIAGGVKDAWFVGYTPELTGAVWIGYDRTDREHYVKTGSGAAASVFREIMSAIVAGKAPSEFTVPEGFQSYMASWKSNGYTKGNKDDQEKKPKEGKKKKDKKKKEKKKERGKEKKKERDD